MAAHPPPKVLSLNGKAWKPAPGGWFFHPFELAVAGIPGTGKTDFIRSLLHFLSCRSVRCGLLTEVSDQVVMEQEQLLNDLLLIDSVRTAAVSHFLFLDSSGESLSALRRPEYNPDETLIGIIGNHVSLEILADMHKFANIPKFEPENLATIFERIENMITEKTPPLSALLLSGGKSIRMGRDKTGIKYRSEPQIIRMINLLDGIGSRPVTISIGHRGLIPPELESPAASGELVILPDQFDGLGPMGGILTAMKSRPDAAWLVAAVDLPLLDESDISFLVRNRNPLSFATAFGTPLPEPVFTIYEPKSLPRMLALLGRGIMCPRGFLRETHHQRLELPRSRALFNANTPHEMEEARKYLREQSENTGQPAPGESTVESARPSDKNCADTDTLTGVAQLDTLLRRLDTPKALFPPAARLSLNQAFGRVLSEVVTADRDQPPFNRAAMDGIAVRSADLRNGAVDFSIKGTLPAGSNPAEFRSPKTGDAVEIMTGASLPDGYDTVIRYEYLRIEGKNATSISQKDSEGVPWKNVHRRGSDYRKGDIIVSKGSVINSAVSATLASTGYSIVNVESPPKITLFSTGSELVPVDSEPRDWQIRQSNISALAAELRGWGIPDIQEGHLQDDREQILQSLKSAMSDRPVLILSGGVSKGKFDYIPAVLKKLGVEILAHGIAQKPGKPFLVGLLRAQCVVFALPGNPVASIISLRRFVVPFLLGQTAAAAKVQLKSGYRLNNSMTQFLAVKLGYDSRSVAMANVLKSNGSGDFFHLLDSDGFVEIPAGFHDPPAIVDFYAWAGRSRTR